MADINIDGKEYNTEALSESALNQLGSVQACDQKISQLNVDLAIAQTARSAYASALKAVLLGDEDNGDSISATDTE